MPSKTRGINGDKEGVNHCGSPVILFYDVHSSHYMPEAASEGVNYHIFAPEYHSQ